MLILFSGLLFSISVTLTSTLHFAWMLRLCISECHNTFTLGEAMIVSQGLVLFTAMSVMKFLFDLHSDDDEMEFISVIVFVSNWWKYYYNKNIFPIYQRRKDSSTRYQDCETTELILINLWSQVSITNKKKKKQNNNWHLLYFIY